ncbi:MAG: hypothetical protein LBP82_03875 [Candidatus Methanoplasma sp.]|nr:hypothetical protein [Candidatus Methanoplasma sp.]
MKVEILSVSRAADGSSNDNVYAVQFGRMMPMDDKRYKTYTINGMDPSFLVLTSFYKFEDSAPYRVGSKWDLQVSDNGTLKLEEEK